MSKLTIVFPSDDSRNSFMSWLSDAGGEQSFMNDSARNDEKPITRFDYAKAFPAWGYDPEKDGDPMIECTDYNDDDTVFEIDHDNTNVPMSDGEVNLLMEMMKNKKL